jgi:hypothetical protein
VQGIFVAAPTATNDSIEIYAANALDQPRLVTFLGGARARKWGGNHTNEYIEWVSQGELRPGDGRYSLDRRVRDGGLLEQHKL